MSVSLYVLSVCLSVCLSVRVSVCMSVCLCVCLGVNSFVLSLSNADDDAVSWGLSLYEALRHCRELGALAVIQADTQPSFSALVRYHFSFILLLLMYCYCVAQWCSG